MSSANYLRKHTSIVANFGWSDERVLLTMGKSAGGEILLDMFRGVQYVHGDA